MIDCSRVAVLGYIFFTVYVTFIHIVLVVSRRVKQTLIYDNGDYAQHYGILICT